MNTSNQIRTEQIKQCPLCKKEKHHLLFTADDTLHGMPGKWGVNLCENCGLMFTSPRPDRESIASFYPSDYSPFASFSPATQPHSWRQIGKKLYLAVINTKELVTPKSTGTEKLLEVGCATGRNLAHFHNKGWQLWGLEPSITAVDALKKHIAYANITCGNIEMTEYPNDFFDLIIASMVIEHLHNPVHDLKKTYLWLKPGGYISGSVPNCSSWEFKTFGPRWYALQVPTHLFHFTPETLRKVLEKSGFRNITIYQQRNVNNLMIHLGQWLERKRLPFAKTFLAYPETGPWWLRLANHPAAMILAWINQAGRISFTAQK